ncbi:MAG: N-acetyltransferase [Chloroflexi bacterium]|nr:MAG: N-acetyltransferase [Chloroflexota bacterium]
MVLSSNNDFIMTQESQASSAILELQSDRLRLIACPLQVAEFALHHAPTITTLLGIKVSQEWPLDEVKNFITWYGEQLAKDKMLLGWGLWLMVHRADNVIIGDVGFKGRPGKDGTIDIGYSIVPSYRRQGYTIEAASRLMAWALQQPRVRRVTARCLQNNFGSIRVLEKLGMRRVSHEAEWVYWELLNG